MLFGFLRSLKTRHEAGPSFMGLLTVAAMATLLVIQLSSPAAAAEEPVGLKGAGATFPMPVYLKWAQSYARTGNVKVDYQGIGSGGGISQIKAKLVDFGASDEPLPGVELMTDGLIQFPMIMGGVAPVHNIPGIRKGRLKLTPELLVDILLGKIEKWNDRRVAAVNPDTKLPDLPVTVVHRADKSGTTWIFTKYLSKVSEEWKTKVGAGKTVSWPTGVGGKGNPGVAALVKKTEGAIGYVEYAYALKNNLKYAQLQNRAGKFLKPSSAAFQSSAANADWEKAEGFYVLLVDQPGENSWPITGVSYILLHKQQPDLKKAESLLKFFEWAYKKGADQASELDYVPMPQAVYKLVEDLWRDEITAGDKQVWKEEGDKRADKRAKSTKSEEE